ncbi:MAG: chemotaxis protein CheA, partial [Desulfovibrio sp.]|nr:chemotaxis protein CheA [Desulfovibrio sp.]
MIESIRHCIEGFERDILKMEQHNGQGVKDVLNTMGLTHVKLPSSQVIALMDMLSDGITPVSPDIVTALLTICEGYKKLLYAMSGLLEEGVMNAPAPVDEPEQQPEPQDQPEAEASPEEPASQEKTDTAQAQQQVAAQAIKSSNISSIRVDTERLDRIIELVGKLMVTYAVISQSGETGSQQTAS